MHGARKAVMVGLSLVAVLAACGGPLEDVDGATAPSTSTAELKNGGVTPTGWGCSANGNPGCSISCKTTEMPVCVDAICIATIFPGVCLYSGPASCECKARPVHQLSTPELGVAGGPAEAAP